MDIYEGSIVTWALLLNPTDFYCRHTFIFRRTPLMHFFELPTFHTDIVFQFFRVKTR